MPSLDAIRGAEQFGYLHYLLGALEWLDQEGLARAREVAGEIAALGVGGIDRGQRLPGPPPIPATRSSFGPTMMHRLEYLREPGDIGRILGKDARQISCPQVLDQDLTEYVAEIRRMRQVLIRPKPGPTSEHPTTSDSTANNEHNVPMAMIRAAVAVLPHGATEL